MFSTYSDNRNRQQAFLAAGGFVYKIDFYDLGDRPRIQVVEG
jgi:hypothetical protein